MNGIVDRIEDGIIVVEVDEKIYNVSSKLAKGRIREGDVVDIVMQDDEIICIKRNKQETENRKKYIEDLTQDMWQ